MCFLRQLLAWIWSDRDENPTLEIKDDKSEDSNFIIDSSETEEDDDDEDHSDEDDDDCNEEEEIMQEREAKIENNDPTRLKRKVQREAEG